jgi:hypothetical protein
MAQPPTYVRQFDFSDFQSVNPDEPLPGNQVDAELNAVKLTADAINQNLAIIQRDDGLLANQSVHPQALSTATLTLLNDAFVQRGAWVTLTVYAVGDVVQESSDTYLCLVAHTAGTFATDLAAMKWALLTQQGMALDGSSTPTANLPMGGFKFTNLGNGSARTDSINLGQAQDMSIQWAAVSGTANAIVLTLTPAITTYVAGQTWKFKATATNTLAATVNAGGGVIAVRYNNAALVGGEIVNGRTYELTYDGTVAQLSNYHEATIPIAAGGTGQITAALAFAALKQAATDSATGVVEKATQTEVNQGTADKFPDAALMAAASYIGRRNRVINGDFKVWQRGAGFSASFASPANASYVADRWKYQHDGTQGTRTLSCYALSQSERASVKALTGSAPTHALRWNQSTAGSGQGFKRIAQFVENLSQFQSCAVTVSFVAWVASGTLDVFSNSAATYGTGGAPSADEVVVANGVHVVTTTPQRFSNTFTVSDFSGKTFGTDGLHTSAITCGINPPLNTAHDLFITDVQFEIGEVATRFDRRQFAEELRDCQRYFWKSFVYATAPATNAGNTGSINWAAVGVGAVASRSTEVAFPVPMRLAPTVTTYNPEAANAEVRNDTDNADCTSTAGAGTDRGLIVTYTGTAGTAQNESMRVHASADAEF